MSKRVLKRETIQVGWHSRTSTGKEPLVQATLVERNVRVNRLTQLSSACALLSVCAQLTLRVRSVVFPFISCQFLWPRKIRRARFDNLWLTRKTFESLSSQFPFSKMLENLLNLIHVKKYILL